MVYGQQFWPLKGQRPQERPKTILACGSRAEWAEVGRLQQPHSPLLHFTWLPTILCRKIPAQCTLPLACAHALLCTQCTSPGCPPHCAGIFLLSALSLCRARAHFCAHSALHLAAHHTVQEYSCSVVHQKLFHVFHPPLPFFNKSTLCSSLLSTAWAGA